MPNVHLFTETLNDPSSQDSITAKTASLTHSLKNLNYLYDKYMYKFHSATALKITLKRIAKQLVNNQIYSVLDLVATSHDHKQYPVSFSKGLVLFLSFFVTNIQN